MQNTSKPLNVLSSNPYEEITDDREDSLGQYPHAVEQ